MRLYDIYQAPPVPYQGRELPRYIEDELRRVADLKEDRLNQCDVLATWNPTIIIVSGVLPTWGAMIAAGTAPQYIVPDMAYDSTTGKITAIYDGVYHVSLAANILDPGGNIALQQWLGLGVSLNWTAGAPTVSMQQEQEQTRDILCNFDAVIAASAGDTIDPLFAAWADTFTVEVTATAYAEITRLR